MKPVVYVLVAMVLYAIANVVMEQKLSKVNTLTFLTCYSVVLFISSGTARLIFTSPQVPYDFPTGTLLAVTLITGLLYFVADYFYLGAYTIGGTVLTITSINVMFPVFASIIKYGVTRDLPNPWQIGGYLFGVIAVLMVAKGATIK